MEAPSFEGVGGVAVAVAVGSAEEEVEDPSRKSFRPWEVEAPFSFPFAVAVAAESDGEEGASYSVGAWEEEAFCPLVVAHRLGALVASLLVVAF